MNYFMPIKKERLQQLEFWGVGFILLFSTNMGVLEEIGISPTVVRIACSMLAFVLLIFSLRHDIWRGQVLLLKWLALPLVAIFIGVGSAVFAQANSFEIVVFLREMLSPLIFLALFLNMKMDTKRWKNLFILLAVMAILQIPVVLGKYLLLGVNEKDWIGTFHQNAGQLGLLMPMIIVVFLWAYALRRDNMWPAIVLATVFSLMSVVCEKRAIVFIMPVSMLSLIAVNWWAQKKNKFSLSSISSLSASIIKPYVIPIFALFLSSILVIYAAFANIDSFDTSTTEYVYISKEAKNGRSTVLDYTIEYLTRGYDSPINRSEFSVDENRNTHLGRIRLWAEGFKYMAQQNTKEMLFGFGGGWLLEHKLMPDKPRDLMYVRTKLRGPASSGVRHLFEIGLGGVAIITLWFLQIGWVLLRRTLDYKHSVLALGGLGVWALFAFDYILYSQVGLSVGVFAPVCCFLVAAAIRTTMTGSDKLEIFEN